MKIAKVILLVVEITMYMLGIVLAVSRLIDMTNPEEETKELETEA
jgi:hypothetical protein